jgi:hypothetical protein
VFQMQKQCLFVVFAMLVISGQAIAAPAPLAPDLQEALRSIRADPRPKALVKGTHYVTSNEPKQWLFREAMTTPGGIHVGVGAEQNYLFMGWSRPEVAILMDFDELIPRLHDAYAAIFRRVDTPEAFLECWTEAGHDRVLGWIDEDYQRPRLRGVRDAWKFARPRAMQHLHDLAESYRKRGMPSFLSDLEQYTFVRDMVRAGRVHAVRGDVTKHRTLRDIAAFANKACLPIRTLYLSNVEGYIDYYIPNYRKNIIGLPGDADSVVLQTDPSGGHTYRYVAQPLSVYRDWIQCKCVYQISVLRPYFEPRGDQGLLTLTKRPAAIESLAAKVRRAGPAPSLSLQAGCPK